MLLMAVFVSCKKTTNLDVSFSNSGKLSYKLMDDAGKGIPNVKVSLFDHIANYYSGNTILIDERQTDVNGLVDFGDLNPKSYLIVADSAKVKNVNYSIKEYVQVVTGVSKHRDVKVTDFSGTLSVKVISHYTNKPSKNIGVFLMDSNNYVYDSNVTKSLNASEFKGITNEEGLITFKVPSDRSYAITIYNTETNVIYGYSHVSVQKGASITQSMGFYQ